MCPTGSPKAGDMRWAFEILDVDRDGKISQEDLQIFYPDATAAEEMMKVADLNKDGYVEYQKVLLLLLRSSNGGVNVMEEVFNAMDRDGDGKVGHQDLTTYLPSAGIHVTPNAMLRLAGGDVLDFQRFLNIFAI